MQSLLKQKQHEEQAYRVCLGLLNLSRRYPVERLNTPCGLANKHQLYRLKNIKAILETNQDQLVTESAEPALPLPQAHENIRGPKSFH